MTGEKLLFRKFAGKFSIYDEIKGANMTSPVWAVAVAETAAIVEKKSGAADKPPDV
jgi:hypothetical protein